MLDRLSGQSVVARVAGHILQRGAAAGGTAFTLGATQRELAEDLGTVREVVVRCLGRLCREGSIERVGRGRWRVLDREKLTAAARN